MGWAGKYNGLVLSCYALKKYTVTDMCIPCQVIGTSEPKTWDEYEQNCITTFGGGYHEQDDLRIFQHGMRTIFNLLRNEFPEPFEILGDGK